MRKARNYARKNGAGVAGSAVLHALIFALILLFLARNTPQPQLAETHLLPVDIVPLGEETTAPPTLQRSTLPQERARRIPVPQSQSPQAGVAPLKTQPLEDSVEAKLRGLAKLREPDKALPALDNAQDSNVDTTSADAASGDEAAYSLRDYIRAVVERRWSLDFALLGKRDFKIAIHVQMTREGKIMLAEIVDKQRYKKDAVFREIALSARNAVILSSPVSLPPGAYRAVMDMVITVDPKDTLH